MYVCMYVCVTKVHVQKCMRLYMPMHAYVEVRG